MVGTGSAGVESAEAAFAERVKAGDGLGALCRLRQSAGSGGSYAEERRHAAQIKNLPDGLFPLTPIRIAILSSSTAEHFVEILKFRLVLAGFDPEFYVGDFGTVVQSIYDENGALYAFKPDVVWMFTNHRDVTFDISMEAGADEMRSAVDGAVSTQISLLRELRNRSAATVVVNNSDIPVEQILGGYEVSVPASRRNLLKRYNLELAHAVGEGILVFDLEGLASKFGGGKWFDDRYWHHSKHAFAFDAYGMVAHKFSRLVAGARGRSSKCVVLDLDNTLWGGVIGDEGVDGIELGNGSGADGEAFTAFQRYLKGLKSRGVILAVCSKNDLENAEAPFDSHPDMILKRDDFASFQANWDDKATNLKRIADEVNIGLDSLVFVDDNPAERELVRAILPEVWVPEMTDDPADYVRILDGLRLFEMVTFSEEDRRRADLYVENSRRSAHQSSFEDLDTYLKSLQMEAEVSDLTGPARSRSIQLINRSNQFNLTGARITEPELERYLSGNGAFGLCFRLRDRFGDNGIISVILGRVDGGELIIDTWVMSCRVLSRGMENFVIGQIAAAAEEKGAETLVGKWEESGRNNLVKELYDRLGFGLEEEAEGTTRWKAARDAISTANHISVAGRG